MHSQLVYYNVIVVLLDCIIQIGKRVAGRPRLEHKPNVISRQSLQQVQEVETR